MQTIWKFPIPVDDCFELEMPTIRQPLSVQLQNGKPCLWALVDPGSKKQKVRCAVWGTGHPHQEGELQGFAYIGTWQMSGGALVFHLFMEQWHG